MNSFKPQEKMSVRRLEDDWKIQTTKGNALFEKSSFCDARDTYRITVRLARWLLQRQTECREEGIPEQALHNIACANLGNTFLELGHLKTAENCFLDALDVASLAYNQKTPEVSGSDLRVAVLNYTGFCQRSARPPDTHLLASVGRRTATSSLSP